MSIANKLQTVANNLATENEKIAEQASLLAQINEALDGKTGTMGGGDYSDGYTDGYEVGYDDGYEDGTAEGGGGSYDEGYEDGQQSVQEMYQPIFDEVNIKLEAKGVEKAYVPALIPQRVDEVYDKGYEDGTAQGGGEDDLPYGYVKIDPTWTSFDNFCMSRPSMVGHLKYSDTANGVRFASMFNNCKVKSIPSLDLRKGTHFGSMFIYSGSIEEIGEMDISNAVEVTYMFLSCSGLKRISFVPGCIKLSLNFAQSSKLDDASIQSIIDGLADLSGKTAQTLTLHATVGAKLTEAQKATASAKNWTLAY